MDPNNYTILIVDDEPDILEFLSYNLQKEGFNVLKARDGKEALNIASVKVPDLVLLDVMMPEMDGMETCEEIRKLESLSHVLVAFLTARGEDYSQIAGFEAGADDYITKPVKPKVLISRIKALLKRQGTPSHKADDQQSNILIQEGDIIIDREKYLVTIKNVPMELPKKEFELLNLLISKPNRVFTRDEIFHHVWGDDIIVGDRTIDVHIRKLREKIGEERIRTIKGVGYKFS